jgi:AraC-like DNA-binding protein
LSVVVIRVPPLREYPEDVPELLRHHVDLLVDSEGLPFRRFSVAAQNRLRNYPWPRNVRELRNMVKRLLILGGPEEISLSEVEAQLATDTADREPLVKQDLLAMPLREAREHFERAYLQQQLLLCGGKVGQLAKRVGMERTHLYRKLRSLGVDFRQSLTDVDTGVAELPLRAFRRVDVADRADANAIEHIVFDLDALHVGFEAEQCEVRFEAVCIGGGAERTRLQKKTARRLGRPRTSCRRHWGILLGNDDLELRQDFVELEAVFDRRGSGAAAARRRACRGRLCCLRRRGRKNAFSRGHRGGCAQIHPDRDDEPQAQAEQHPHPTWRGPPSARVAIAACHESDRGATAPILTDRPVRCRLG